MVKTEIRENQDFRIIGKLLDGKFNNSAQAAQDSEFTLVYYHNCLVKIQDSYFGENYLTIFAQQTANTPLVKFARRRLMHIFPTLNQQETEVAFYTLKEDEQFANFSAQPLEKRIISSQDIHEYECSLFFIRQGDIFVGGTPKGGCEHHYRGAEKLIIEAVLSSEKLSVWERWYDRNGKQVAGSRKSPYIYTR